MGDRLAGRHVVVTGAAAGIGRATARRVTDEGARVALLDVIPPDALDFRLAEGRNRYWQADVRNPQAIADAAASMADWLGRVDVLLHIAGIMRAQRTRPEELDLEVWQEVIDVNLRGSMLMVQHLLPHLTASRGVIVLTSSKGGVTEGSGSVPYGASKGGVHGLALTLERALEPRGIRVNELAPGSIDTPLFRRSAAEAAKRTGEPAIAEQLLRDAVSPEGVASILAFLASSDAADVRGTIRTR